MKLFAGSDRFPFGQVPIVEEIQVKSSTTTLASLSPSSSSSPAYLCQMDSILRKLGRKYGQYNGSDDDLYLIDIVLSGGLFYYYYIYA